MPDVSLLLRSWYWPPLVILGLVMVAAAYAYAFYHFHQHGWLPRLVRRGLLRRYHPWCFAGGLLALALALLSPIDTLSDWLFVAHMAQHLLMAMVAPPLLLLGLPAPLARWFIMETRLRGLLEHLTHPLLAFALYNANLLLWHLPAVYQSALTNTLIHDLQHALFFYTAVLFWWRVIDPTHGWFSLWQWPPAKWLYLLVAAPPSYILGSILWAHNRVLYPWYAAVPRLGGLSALEDQHYAGLLMWGHGWMFLMASMVAFYSWYNPQTEQLS